MKHDSFDNIVADAVAVYKHLLKKQEDNSVIIISLGFLNNLNDLLKNPEGLELVERKVKLVAIMAGLHIVRYILIMTTRPIDQCPDHSYRKDEKQLKSHHQ